MEKGHLAGCSKVDEKGSVRLEMRGCVKEGMTGV